MIVLVDTTIWSLALRRRRGILSERERRLVEEWARLVRSGEAVLIGPIRQEILSGIRTEKSFAAIQESLTAALPPVSARCAACRGRCRG